MGQVKGRLQWSGPHIDAAWMAAVTPHNVDGCDHSEDEDYWCDQCGYPGCFACDGENAVSTDIGNGWTSGLHPHCWRAINVETGDPK